MKADNKQTIPYGCEVLSTPWAISDSHGLCIVAVGDERRMVLDGCHLSNAPTSRWQAERHDLEVVVHRVNCWESLYRSWVERGRRIIELEEELVEQSRERDSKDG